VRFRGRSIAVLVVAACTAGCSWFGVGNAPAAFQERNLVDRSGFALYRYDRDVPFSAKSLCVGPCTETWRPYLAAPEARRRGDFALITRPEGGRQWVFRGQPLYRYAKDAKPGDTTGHGVDNLWRIVER
jgi:predicted lipoprotein with Yx(FWY)xxD motif